MTAGHTFHRFDRLPPCVFPEVTGLTLTVRRQGDDIVVRHLRRLLERLAR